MRFLASAIVCLLLVAGTVAGARLAVLAQEATPTGEPQSTGALESEARALDTALKDALAAGDAAAVAALFAPNGVEVNPFGVFVGRDEIRGFGESFVSTNPGLAVNYSETEVVFNTAVHRMSLSSDPIRAMGIERVLVTHTLVASEGQIVTLTAVFDSTDDQTRQYLAALAGGSGTPAATPAA